MSRRVHVREVPFEADAARAYGELTGPYRFWLDSSGPGRFSFVGSGSECLTHRVSDGPFLDRLDALLRERRTPVPDGLPFAFAGGYVGWLGYELKAETGGAAVFEAPTPDAALVFADRLLAIDHRDERSWLIALSPPHSAAAAAAEAWLADSAARLVPAAPEPADPPAALTDMVAEGLALRHDEKAYAARIEACLEHIRAGDSYEICLTNEAGLSGPVDVAGTYAALRRISPVPYGALLEFDGVAVLSASPERFLSVDTAGEVESRPIKGTRPRGATPAEDAALRADLLARDKDRAENVMIVDLIRNDLTRVCTVGSVRVPHLFQVETYAPVHQLVSTVRGTLRPGLSAVDAVRAAFPGGSMTGAPKVSTMAILDELEGGPRGIYSGALGWFGLSGAADLSIVIRTLVVTADRTTFGVGGAVTALSDVDEEWTETVVKSRAMTTALRAAGPAGAAATRRAR